MAQVKIYALASALAGQRTRLSEVIHGCVMEALEYPPEKRFYRFFPLAAEDFLYPEDRSERYTILEIQLFAGRSAAAKKQLIRSLFGRFASELGYHPNDLEIHLLETSRADWGIRGLPGDELLLGYTVDV